MTAEIIAESGIEGLTIRSVSDRSGVPSPTVYRYFADRDEIAAAFLDREMEKIDASIAVAFSKLERVTLRGIVELAMFTHVRHHQQNPGAVMAWFGSPRTDVVYERIKRQDERLAAWLRAATETARMVRKDAPLDHVDLLIRLGDRTNEYLFTGTLTRKQQNDAARHYVEMVASYLERFATKAGLEGISPEAFLKALGEQPAHFGA